jgi:hypothetical protein
MEKKGHNPSAGLVGCGSRIIIWTPGPHAELHSLKVPLHVKESQLHGPRKHASCVTNKPMSHSFPLPLGNREMEENTNFVPLPQGTLHGVS